MKTSIERFDLATGWPVEVYGGIREVFGGYSRTAIKLALNGISPTAAGYGWRRADAVSRLPEFVAECCIEQPDAPIDFTAMADRLQEWAGQPGDVARLRALIQSRYGTSGLSLHSVPVDALAAFIASHVHCVQDSLIPFGEFYARFIGSLPKNEPDEWSKFRVSRSLPWKHRGKRCLSNAVWRPIEASPSGDKLAAFVAEHLHEAPGHLIAFSDFYARFKAWLPTDQRNQWSQFRVSRGLPLTFQAGKGTANKVFLINAAWEQCEAGPPYVVASKRQIRRPGGS